MTRYFDSTTDGQQRIAVVITEDDSPLDRFGDEIAEADLPGDFGEWRQYTAFAHDDCAVRVMSPRGD